MLIDRYKPLYAPEAEAGTGEPEPGADAGGAPPAAPPMNEAPVDGPGSGRSKVRQQLEKATGDLRKTQEQQEKQQGRDRKSGQYTSRARQEGIAEDPAEGEQPAEGAAEGEGEAPDAPDVNAPEAWTREAKAEWANLPPAVQAAVAKREADVATGVKQLQDKYKEIDQALAPRMETLKRTGHSPAQAVNQLFLWFEALTADAERIKQGQPAQAFPALMQSFGIHPGYFAPQQPAGGQPAQQQPVAAQQAGAQAGSQPGAAPAEIPPWFQEHMAQLQQALGQKFGSFEQALAAQNAAKTQEVLSMWSKDKPYFEEVRVTMAQLLQAGAVPPLANGAADLDKAYDMALYALPDVRTKVLADQQKAADAARRAKADAEKKAQQEQADKARRAAVALGPSAPGSETPATKGGAKRKSVRESLQDAMQEVNRGRA